MVSKENPESNRLKRNANATAALLTNFSTAEKALDTALNSAGSASEENRKYLESLGGRMTLLKASFEDFSQTILASNVFKFFISGTTGAINGLTSLMKAIGAIPVTLATATASWKAYEAAKAAATRIKEGPDKGTITQRIKSAATSNMAGGVWAYTKGDGLGLNLANKQARSIEATFNKVSSTIGSIRTGISNIVAGVTKWDKLSRKIQSSKAAANAAMQAGDYAGVVANTGEMNAAREQLRSMYKELESTNAEMAAKYKGTFQSMMMGGGDQIGKTAAAFDKIKTKINSATTAMKGLNASEKAAYVTTNLLNGGFKVLQVSVATLAGIMKAAAGAFIMGFAIQAVVTLVEKFANRYEEAATKAKDAAESAREIANANREASKSVDDVAKQYERLGDVVSTSESENAENRSTLLGMQTELNDLLKDQSEEVQKQANGLDLVNGRYETQLQILKDIKNQQLSEAIDTGSDSVTSDIKSSKATYRDEKSKKFDRIVVDKSDKEGRAALEYLKNSKYSKYFQFDRFGNYAKPQFIGGGIESTIDQYRLMDEVLQDLIKHGFKANNVIVSGLRGDSSELGTNLQDSFADIRNTFDTILEYKSLDSPFDESSEKLDEYKKKLRDFATEQQVVKDALAEGFLTNDQIDTWIDTFLKSNFSEAYSEQIIPEMMKSKIAAKFGSQSGKTWAESFVDGATGATKKNVEEMFSGEKELEIAYQLVGDKNKSFENLEQLKKAVQEQLEYEGSYDGIAENLRKQLSDVTSDDSLKTDFTSLKKKANKEGITTDDIDALAAKSATLAEILESDGVSAEYLASVFQREFASSTAGSGISSITGAAIELNEALDGMANKLDEASVAKKKYDQAMNKGNSDDNFEEYASAYEKAYSAMMTGDTGSGSTDFWAGAELLLGEDQLKAMKYDVDAVIEKMKQLGPIFSGASSEGVGLVQKLKSMADESGNVYANGKKVATVITEANGSTSIDIRAEDYAALAAELGVSEAAFTTAMHAAEKWANVTTFSTNEVYNTLRNTGNILDNTSGKFDEFANTQIIDIGDLHMTEEQLAKFKRELDSTGESFTFLDLTHGADAAIESLEKVGVAKEKLLEDGSGTGTYDINTGSLNSLLAGLDFNASQVEALYKSLEKDGVMSTDAVADAMEDYNKKVNSGKGFVKELKDWIDSLPDKDVELKTTAEMNGQTIDPNDPALRRPDKEALEEFKNNKELNPNQLSSEMQEAYDTVNAGWEEYIKGFEATKEELESMFQINGYYEFSQEYVDAIKDEIDALPKFLDSLYNMGANDNDPQMKAFKEKLSAYTKELAGYYENYYEARSKLAEDAVAEIEENPFGDPVSDSEKTIAIYEDFYDELIALKEDAIARGIPLDAEFFKEIDKQIRATENKVETSRRNAFKSQTSSTEFQIDILGRDRHDGESVDDIVSLYSGLMAQVEAEMARERAKGVNANNEYLQELTRQWYDYRDNVREAQKQVYSELTAFAQHQTTMMEYSIVGSSQKGQLIGAYQNEIQATLSEIEALAEMGYYETDQEIYSLRERVAALNNSIREVQKELAGNAAAYAKHLSNMQQFAVNRGADPRSMISFYQNEQSALQQEIADLAAMGYAATDQEIYSLVEQIESLNDSIMSAQAAWINMQSQADQRMESMMTASHSSSSSMMEFYDTAWRNAVQRYNEIRHLGYGDYSSEASSAFNEYLSYLQKYEEAYRQSMQEAIDVYDYYIKQLDVSKAPFEEYVRVLGEQEELVQHMLNEMRSMGYAENSSEIVALKNQLLSFIGEVENRASEAFNRIGKQFSHQLTMLENNSTTLSYASLSIDILKQQQAEYHKLADELRMQGYNEDSEVLMSIEEGWWDVQKQIVESYKTMISEIEAMSEHRVSMVFDRHNYSFSEYVEEYRYMQQQLHATAEQYRAMGIDENDELIRELQDKWWEYEDKVAEVFQKLVSDANEAIETLKGAYDDFFAAADDYTQYGTLTYDTFKAILDLGPEYMAYLKNTNGMLEVSKKTMQQVISAKAEELAINQALNYVEQIREARQNENYDTLERLTKGIQESADATWESVYASLALINLTESEYAGAIENLNRYRSLAKQFSYDIDAALDSDMVKSLDDLSGSFDDFVGYVEDMIKAEHEDMKDALDDQLDLYEEIVKKKKEALELAKSEADYEESVADQVKEIAKLQNQIDQLSLDNSREATAKRKKLEEDLASATKKLANDQRDHAMDATKDQLDADKDALSESVKKQKEAIDEEVSSAEKIHRLAMDRIMQYGEDNLDKLLSEVLDWNLRAGNSLERNIKDTWTDIIELVERYGGLVGAIEAIRANSLKETVKGVVSSGSTKSESESSNTVGVSSDIPLSVGRSYYGSTEGTQYKEALNEMIQNSVDWWVAKNAGDAVKAQAEADKNLELSESFKAKTGVTSYRDNNGRWWIAGAKNEPMYENQDVGQYVVAQMKDNFARTGVNNNSENIQLADALAHYTGANVEYKDGTWYYNGKELYDESLVFHKGGIVGKSTMKQDEVMAKLQEGEIILNKERQKGLFKLVDLASYLSDKLGVKLKKGISLSGGSIAQDLDIGTTRPNNTVNSSFQFAPEISVSITGGTEDEGAAKKYAKQIADLTLGNLKDAFAQKGITKALAGA